MKDVNRIRDWKNLLSKDVSAILMLNSLKIFIDRTLTQKIDESAPAICFLFRESLNSSNGGVLLSCDELHKARARQSARQTWHNANPAERTPM